MQTTSSVVFEIIWFCCQIVFTSLCSHGLSIIQSNCWLHGRVLSSLHSESMSLISSLLRCHINTHGVRFADFSRNFSGFHFCLIFLHLDSHERQGYDRYLQVWSWTYQSCYVRTVPVMRNTCHFKVRKNQPNEKNAQVITIMTGTPQFKGPWSWLFEEECTDHVPSHSNFTIFHDAGGQLVLFRLPCL